MSISEPLDHRKYLEEHLEGALKRIVDCIDSPSDKLALAAARWVAEMVLGRPNQAIQVEHGSKELAVELVKALREAFIQVRLERPPEPHIIEGKVRVLGLPPGAPATTLSSETVSAEPVVESITADDFPA